MDTKRDQRWIKNEEITLENVTNGLDRKILAYNKDLMIVENHFEVGAIGAMHSHPHTQITYVVSGKFCFNIDDEMKVVTAGDAMLKTDSVKHGCVCIEEGILLDVFTPMREDFVADREEEQENEEEQDSEDESEEEDANQPDDLSVEAETAEMSAIEKKQVKVALAGIGRAGINLVNEALAENIPVAKGITVDMDAEALDVSVADHRILIKDGIEDTLLQVGSILEDVDVLLIAAGMGGQTGTLATPLIADLAKEMGILTIAFVVKPFMFEGSPRLHQAIQGINRISEFVNALVVIDNNRLMEMADRKLTIPEAMKIAGESYVTVSKVVSYLAIDEETTDVTIDDIMEILEVFVIGDELNSQIAEVYC